MAQGNISEFTSPVDSLHPTEVGVDAYQQAGAKANRIFTELGASHEQTGRQVAQDIGGGIKAAGQAAEDTIDYQQKSRGMATEAGLIDTAGRTWDDALKNANPGDTTTADTFKQNVLEPELENWQKGFTTQKGQEWAQSRVEAIRQHFNTVTAAGMGDLAAASVDTELRTMGNTWQTTAMRDPGQVPFLLKTASDHIETLVNATPNLTGPAAIKAKNEFALKTEQGIVKAGMVGAIQNSSNPEGTAAAWMKQYPSLIDGTEAIQIARTAKMVDRFNAASAKAAQAADRQAAKDDFEDRAAKLAASAIQPDGSRKAPADYFNNVKALALHHPGATPEKIEALYNAGQPRETETVTDPGTKLDLQNKLIAGTLTPTELVAATNDNTGHGLATKDYTALEGQRKLLEEHPLNDKGFEAATKAALASMVVPTNYSDFLQEFLPSYLKLDPKDKAAALNFSDPNSLISKTMATHEATPAQKIQFKVMQNLGQGIDTTKIAPQIPAGMSIEDAAKKYGHGAIVNKDGRLVVLP